MRKTWPQNTMRERALFRKKNQTNKVALPARKDWTLPYLPFFLKENPEKYILNGIERCKGVFIYLSKRKKTLSFYDFLKFFRLFSNNLLKD